MRPAQGTSLLQRLAASVDHLLGIGPRMPPFAPALAVAAPSTTAAPSGWSDKSIGEMVRDMGILWGVPKYRTSKPKKQTRKFSYTRLFSPKTNIVQCGSCGSHHEADTICGTCYETVRNLTNRIKEEMMKYNPYKGEKQQEVVVKFSDDANQGEDGVLNGKRVIELDKERPTWFKKIVQ